MPQEVWVLFIVFEETQLTFDRNNVKKVRYQVRNWILLSEYLLNSESQSFISVVKLVEREFYSWDLKFQVMKCLHTTIYKADLLATWQISNWHFENSSTFVIVSKKSNFMSLLVCRLFCFFKCKLYVWIIVSQGCWDSNMIMNIKQYWSYEVPEKNTGLLNLVLCSLV